MISKDVIEGELSKIRNGTWHLDHVLYHFLARSLGPGCRGQSTHLRFIYKKNRVIVTVRAGTLTPDSIEVQCVGADNDWKMKITQAVFKSLENMGVVEIIPSPYDRWSLISKSFWLTTVGQYLISVRVQRPFRVIV